MTRLGMDVDIVDSVGALLVQRSHDLTAIVANVDSLVSRAESLWYGGDGYSFVFAWRSTHRGQVVALAESVAQLGRNAQRNAAEQRGASSSSSGNAGPPPSVEGGLAGGSFFDPRTWIRAAESVGELALGTGSDVLLKGAEMLADLGNNDHLIGRYSSAFHALTDRVSALTGGAVGFDDLKYKSWLNGPLTVNGPLDTLSKSHLLPAIGALSTAFSVAGNLGTVADPTTSTEDRVDAGASVVASGLKQMNNPVAYLSGVIVSEGVLIGQEAREADFSPSGMAMVMDQVRTDPWGSLSAGFTPANLGKIVGVFL